MPSPKVPSTVIEPGKTAGPQPAGGSEAGATAGLLSHLNDPVDAHDGAAISYDGGPSWADGTANPASEIDSQIDKIITDLATGDGAGKVAYDGGPNWKDTTANPATTVGLQIDKIISDLGGGSAGADKVTFDGSGGTWANGSSLIAEAVGAALREILNTLGNQAAANDGAEKVGAEEVTSTGSFGTVATGSVRSQLSNLLNNAAHLSNNNTFSGIQTISSADAAGVLRFSGTSGTHIAQTGGFGLELSAPTGFGTRFRDDGGVLIATFDTTGATFRSSSTLSASIDVNGINIDASTPRLDVTVDSNADFIFKRTDRSGTGFDDGATTRFESQAGQSQTGGNDNNDGGAMEFFAGRPGTGGSGAEGQHGHVGFRRTFDVAGAEVVEKVYGRRYLDFTPATVDTLWEDPEGDIPNGGVVVAEVSMTCQRRSAVGASLPGVFFTALMIWGVGSTGTIFFGPNYNSGAYISEVGFTDLTIELQHAALGDTPRIQIENTNTAAVSVHVFATIKVTRYGV